MFYIKWKKRNGSVGKEEFNYALSDPTNTKTQITISKNTYLQKLSGPFPPVIVNLDNLWNKVLNALWVDEEKKKEATEGTSTSTVTVELPGRCQARQGQTQ